jgi:hypothetical protein
LFTFYLNGFAHVLNPLGIAASLPGAKQYGRDGAKDCEPSRNPERMGCQ